MKGVALPNPNGLKFLNWGALVAEQLAVYGISAPVSEDAWYDWACSLLYVPELAIFPSPSGFAKWDDWAVRVLEAQ